MYVYCNFYCSPAKKNGSDPTFWAGDATDIFVCIRVIETISVSISTLKRITRITMVIQVIYSATLWDVLNSR